MLNAIEKLKIFKRVKKININVNFSKLFLIAINSIYFRLEYLHKEKTESLVLNNFKLQII